MTSVCCVSSAQHIKASVAPGKQKAQCDASSGGNRLFPGAALSCQKAFAGGSAATEEFLTAANDHRTTFSNGICGEPGGRTGLMTFPLFVFPSRFALEADSPLYFVAAIALFSSGGDGLRIDIPSLTPKLALGDA